MESNVYPLNFATSRMHLCGTKWQLAVVAKLKMCPINTHKSIANCWFSCLKNWKKPNVAKQFPFQMFQPLTVSIWRLKLHASFLVATHTFSPLHICSKVYHLPFLHKMKSIFLDFPLFSFIDSIKWFFSLYTFNWWLMSDDWYMQVLSQSLQNLILNFKYQPILPFVPEFQKVDIFGTFGGLGVWVGASYPISSW